MNAKSAIIFILKLAFAGGILWYLRDSIDLELLKSTLSDPILLLVMPIVWVINQMTTAWRLCILLRASNCVVRFRDVIHATFFSLLVSSVLPGIVGSDVAKAALLKNASKARLSSLVGVLLFDRILGLVGLVFVSFGTLLCLPHLAAYQIEVTILALAIATAVGGIFLLAVSSFYRERVVEIGKGKGSIARLARIIDGFLFTGRTYFKATVWSTLGLFMLILGQTVVAMDLAEKLGTPVNPTLICMLFPASILVSVLPITPMGLGLSQAAMAGLFGMVGLPKTLATAVASITQLGQAIVALAGGLPGIFIKRKPRTHQQDSDPLPLRNSPV